MMSEIIRAILEPFCELVFGVLFHLLGSVIIAILTLGHARCERFDPSITWRAHRNRYGWLGIYRRSEDGVWVSGGFTVNTSIVASGNGWFGDRHPTKRTEGSKLFLNPLMTQ